MRRGRRSRQGPRRGDARSCRAGSGAPCPAGNRRARRAPRSPALPPTTRAAGRRGSRAGPRRRRRAACRSSSAATWSARRVFPVPPGPVIVSSRVPFGEQCDELAELVLSTDERARRDRQVGGVERPQRREVAVAQLIQALGSGEVLQPVLSEITSCGVAVQEPSCRLGEDDLSPVSSGGDPGRAVNVDADVAFVRHDRLAGVDSHADPNRAGLELRAAPRQRRQRRRRRWETRRRRHRPACPPRHPECLVNASLRARRCSASRSRSPTRAPEGVASSPRCQ